MPLVRDLSSRARFRLTGPDRVRFLHGMVTSDVEALAPGEGGRAAMLTVKGKLLADLQIYADEDALTLELDGELRTKIHDVLERHLVMDDVEIEDLGDRTRELGVFGDDARAALERAFAADLGALAPYHHRIINETRIAGAPELALPGFHVIGAALPALDGTPLSDDAWEILRVEAGTPRYGVDMEEDRLVLEANLDDAVSLTKGCYLGQEVVARATARGHINRKLRGLLLDGSTPIARGSKISAPAREDAGHVTSSVVSPRLGPIALAYVHRTVWDPGTELVVHDPSGDRKARVSDLPFRPTAA